MRSEMVRKFVRRPPSQRWLTYGWPAPPADSATASRACFFVPTNSTLPLRAPIRLANSCASSTRRIVFCRSMM